MYVKITDNNKIYYTDGEVVDGRYISSVVEIKPEYNTFNFHEGGELVGSGYYNDPTIKGATNVRPATENEVLKVYGFALIQLHEEIQALKNRD
jgi:hypothetical protein